ncbi:hypothetical protein V6N11_051790 [Hibiscus sabdariffa]|uniref:Uncharacterized protein n=1 Tax=Hibiscus sabdariffa TaxID=183260 RepID=A0ABR2U8F1_9ROSI
MADTTHQPIRSRAVPIVPKSVETDANCLGPSPPAVASSSPPADIVAAAPVCPVAHEDQPLGINCESSSTEVMPDVVPAPLHTSASGIVSQDNPMSFFSDVGSEQHSIQPDHISDSSNSTSVDDIVPGSSLQHTSNTHNMEKEDAEILEYNPNDSCNKLE